MSVVNTTLLWLECHQVSTQAPAAFTILTETPADPVVEISPNFTACFEHRGHCMEGMCVCNADYSNFGGVYSNHCYAHMPTMMGLTVVSIIVWFLVLLVAVLTLSTLRMYTGMLQQYGKRLQKKHRFMLHVTVLSSVMHIIYGFTILAHDADDPETVPTLFFCLALTCTWYIETERPMVANVFGFSPKLKRFYSYSRLPLLLVIVTATFCIFAGVMTGDTSFMQFQYAAFGVSLLYILGMGSVGLLLFRNFAMRELSQPQASSRQQARIAHLLWAVQVQAVVMLVSAFVISALHFYMASNLEFANRIIWALSLAVITSIGLFELVMTWRSFRAMIGVVTAMVETRELEEAAAAARGGGGGVGDDDDENHDDRKQHMVDGDTSTSNKMTAAAATSRQYPQLVQSPPTANMSSSGGGGGAISLGMRSRGWRAPQARKPKGKALKLMSMLAERTQEGTVVSDHLWFRSTSNPNFHISAAGNGVVGGASRRQLSVRHQRHNGPETIGEE